MTVTPSSPPTATPWRAIFGAVLPVALAGLVVAGMAVDPSTVLTLGLAGGITLGFAALPLERTLPALVALAPFRLYATIPGTPYEISLTSLITVMVAAFVLVADLARGLPRLTRWEWAFAAWFGWLVLTVLWSSSPSSSMRGVFSWGHLLAVAFLTAHVLRTAWDRGRVLRRLVAALLVLVTIWSIVGFIQAALGFTTVREMLSSPLAGLVYSPAELGIKLGAIGVNWRRGDSVQPFGPFDNAIVFGMFTAMGVGIAAATLVGRVRFAPRWLAVTTVVLGLAADIATLKATGWISAAAALVVAFLVLGGSLGAVVRWGLLLGTAAGLCGFLFRNMIAARLAELAAREIAATGSLDAISRPAVWAHYLRVALTRPLTGHGLNTAARLGPVRQTLATGTDVTISYQLPPENSYLTMAVDTGLPGLAGVLVVLGGALLAGALLSRRFPDDPLAQAAGLGAVGIAALMVGNFAVSALSEETMGVLLGTLLGVVVVARRHAGASGESSRQRAEPAPGPQPR